MDVVWAAAVGRLVLSLIFSDGASELFKELTITSTVLKLQVWFSYQQIAFFELDLTSYRSCIYGASIENYVRFKIAKITQF